MNRGFRVSPPRVTPPRDYRLADWYYDRINIQLKQFQQRLSSDETYTTQIILANGKTVFPRSIGYHNPDMLIADGWDEQNNDVVLLVPPSSTQVIFTRKKKSDIPERQRQPLGFHTPAATPDPAGQSTPSDLPER